MIRRRSNRKFSKAFENFVKEVNSPITYKENTNKTINAIPIIAYHDIDDNKKTPYTTDLPLFTKEMKYLRDNGFKVIGISDLGYDNNRNFLYIKINT
jgi:maleate cis-trans isomerase